MARAFVALYRGDTVGSAELLDLSADRELVALVAERLLERPLPDDPIRRSAARGRRQALMLVRKEAEEEAAGQGRGD